ncbi:MAG: MFS transporter [Chloroflexota bacterium]
MASPRRHYAWIVLAMSTLVVLGSLGLGRFGYTLLLPAMQAGLDLDNAQAGALASANLAGYLALAVLGGALASRYGPRRVIALGLAVSGLGMLLTGLADGFLALAALRLLTGLGSGASNVPVMGLVSAWFVGRRRGLAAGIAVTGSSLALIILGPLVPRVLAANLLFGWRVCWGAYGGVTLILAAAAYALLRDRPSDVGASPVGEAVPLGDLAPPGQAAPPAQAAPARPEPLRWGPVYRAPAVWHLGVVYAAFGFSYIIYMTFFTKHLVTGAGYSAQAAGNLFMVMGWASLLCGVLWGHLSDRIGRKRALLLVYCVHAAAFALFAFWSQPLGLTVSAILFGLSAWSIPAIMAAACGDILGARMAPAALGFLTLFFGIGQAIGPAVAGAMADAWGSFVPAFALAAGVAALGAVGAALLRPTREGNRV